MSRTVSAGEGNQAAPSGRARRSFSARFWVPWLCWLGVVGVAAVTLLAARLAAEAITLEPVPAYAIGFAVVVATVLAAAFSCPKPSRRALVLLAAPLATLWLLHQHGASELTAAIVVTVALLLGGTLLGTAVGGAIEHPGHLLFVAIVSAAVDALSVFHPEGPSAAIAQSKAALSLLALPWPMLGTPNIEPFLGVGDVVFTALYAASSRRHGLGLGRTALGLTLGYTVTMVCVIALETTVPALPLLGLAMVLIHPEARRAPLRDRARGFALAALLVAVVVGLLMR